MCPASCRVISVIDDKFTIEFELETEDTKSLIKELQATDWGRRLASLLENLMPAVEAKVTIQQAKRKFEEEYKDLIDGGKIARVDLGEENENEVLIVWINREVDLPREFCKFEIKEKKSPNYQDEPEETTNGSEVY